MSFFGNLIQASNEFKHFVPPQSVCKLSLGMASSGIHFQNTGRKAGLYDLSLALKYLLLVGILLEQKAFSIGCAQCCIQPENRTYFLEAFSLPLLKNLQLAK